MRFTLRSKRWYALWRPSCFSLNVAVLWMCMVFCTWLRTSTVFIVHLTVTVMSSIVMYVFITYFLHFAWVVDDAKCIVVTRVCVSVCLSAAVRPQYCTDPDVTWGVVEAAPYWADLQSGHGLRCYSNITQTLVTSLRPSRDMTTVRTKHHISYFYRELLVYYPLHHAWCETQSSSRTKKTNW